MASSERPVTSPADARRIAASRVRMMVRTQLAKSQRRRQELSQALRALRHGLREYRSQVRLRLREMSQEAASRRTAPSKPPEVLR